MLYTRVCYQFVRFRFASSSPQGSAPVSAANSPLRSSLPSSASSPASAKTVSSPYISAVSSDEDCPTPQSQSKRSRMETPAVSPMDSMTSESKYSAYAPSMMLPIPSLGTAVSSNQVLSAYGIGVNGGAANPSFMLPSIPALSNAAVTPMSARVLDLQSVSSSGAAAGGVDDDPMQS